MIYDLYLPYLVVSYIVIKIRSVLHKRVKKKLIYESTLSREKEFLEKDVDLVCRSYVDTEEESKVDFLFFPSQERKLIVSVK